MEELLNAIVSKLKIRFIVNENLGNQLEGGTFGIVSRFEFKDVTEEVKEIFKKELIQNLISKLQRAKKGEYIEYEYNFETKKPLGKIMRNANDNLAEVLLKLPKLQYGEWYDLPSDTRFYFKLGEIKSERANVEADVSNWIIEEINKKIS